MLISWNWLKEYVPLGMSADELAMRLMMAGLNHEQSQAIDDDIQIELEVTSNRPDCLGHIGVAREVSVLFSLPLAISPARPPESKTSVADLINVTIDCPELCPRYIARVVRGVRIGPSPEWLVNRLKTIGIASINNVVDVSNYVMMECGQPLHTFDYGKLRGGNLGRPAIIVRTPHPGEKIEAIDHKTYTLDPGMCVIADADKAAAIAGVMGGAESEVTEATRDILIESADFDPMNTRITARRLNLHSDSSYRFERKVDSYNLDWTSRRCAELILQTAGGELAAGAIDVGAKPPAREPVTLRLGQLKRIIGIDIDEARVRQIIVALGGAERKSEKTGSLTFIPPTWRRDLTREIDLVEEVARIHGYDKIPEDVSVPMAPSARRREDRIVSKIRGVLTGAGFDEAMTLSAVDETAARTVKFWTEQDPLKTLMPVLRGADHLRTSLLPSLLSVRRTNESLSNPVIDIFEIAKVYLPSVETPPGLPLEWLMLGISSGRSYAEVRGVIEAIVETLNPKLQLQSADAGEPLVDSAMSCRLMLGSEFLGFIGRVSPQAVKQFELRGPSTVAEIRLAPLFAHTALVPIYEPQTPYPAVSRDLNLVVDEAVRWADVAATVRAHTGPDLEQLDYRDTYRDPERLGPGKKSLLLSFSLRSQHGTLTSQAVDEVRDRVVEACREKHGAELR